MLRLVQGDVGAGKTVVAAAACLYAVEARYQAAMMAPAGDS
jgi:ATP-dependent DNA helicase RecG